MKIRIKAIVLGCLVDLGGSLSVGVAYGLALGISMAVKGMSPEEIAECLAGSVVLVPSLFIGFGFTFLGGFIAGRIAKHVEPLHGAIVGAVGLLFGLLFRSSHPLWFYIISYGAIVPVGLAGGYLAKQTRKQPDNPK